ncbi:MCE family protein [Amycolatopsis acidicola]|uniref:MCE family protein n=1 Tax=Amycolatopsis acidicola TaxID=2596893 RepID=A0A5N0UUS6_9PSEU|nr:MlaD family protein [Amycolatopsis acidicola]KAA9153522.1 MCE family protein [Amycolatopsis acidicola]
MLTRRIRLQVIVFVLLALAGVAYVGARYVGLDRLLGGGGYVVKAEFAEGGGVFTNGEVTYNGVPIGRVGELRLTATGIEAELRIDSGTPPVPSDVEAVVTNRSAVGEQYVDLRPKRGGAPYLSGGATIPQADTALPLPNSRLVVDLDKLVSSVPRDELRTVVDEVYLATENTGPSLQALLDSGSAFVQDASAHLPQTLDLIEDANTVLSTQIASSDAIKSFGTNAKQVAATLRDANGDVRTVLTQAPAAAQQVSALLQETGPGLTTLLANLLTTSQVLLTHEGGVERLLEAAPQAVDVGGKVLTGDGASFGLVTTFFSPLPCTAGYGGTQYRDGLDTSPAPLNTAAGCRR